MTSFKDRMIGAAKLDIGIYEEVEADKTAMGQAMGVVVLSSLAAGIGTIGRGGLWCRDYNCNNCGPNRMVCLGVYYLSDWDETPP